MRAGAVSRGRAVFKHRFVTAALIGLCLLGLGRMAAGLIVPVKAVAAQWLLARAFEHSVATHLPQRPWPWADMVPTARLSVPRLRVSQIVLAGGSGQAMAFGPTLLPGAAQLGSPGTAVMAAHRDTHFAFLRDSVVGDVIAVELTDGSTRRYRVTHVEIVRWDRFAINSEIESEQLMLATCYPFGALHRGPERYVVQATQFK